MVPVCACSNPLPLNEWDGCIISTQLQHVKGSQWEAMASAVADVLNDAGDRFCMVLQAPRPHQVDRIGFILGLAKPETRSLAVEA